MSVRPWGGYVSVDWELDGDNVEPLLWCLSFAVVDHFPLDYFLHGILTGDDAAPSGGDPGWLLYPERVDGGGVIYRAWTDSAMSYLEPCEGDYDEVTVKRLVRRTLENFAKANPQHRPQVESLINEYSL
jgi:hypothetical protein